jgi:RNA polymerase sigma-70 factor (ECF subfamily)
MIADKANMVTDVQEVEIALLRAKNAQAFHSLIERLQQPMIGYLHRLVGEREVALDLAQDTFLQVYKEIDRSSVDGPSLDAWIYRIATNYGLRYLQRKRLKKIMSIFSPPSADTDAAGSPEDGYLMPIIEPGLSVEDQVELRILVQQALATLKTKDAICLQLRYGNGLTYEQIGIVVDLTAEAVRKRVVRSVEKFRQVYDNLPATTATKSAASSRKQSTIQS